MKRSWGLFLFGVFLGLAAFEARAVEIHGNPQSQAGGGLDVYYVQGPHLERDPRIAYNGHYRHHLGILALEGYLLLAPDTGKNSSEVSIYQDYYLLYAGAGVAWPAMFRFSATLGPTLIWEQVKYDAAGSSESLSDRDMGVMGRFAMDYAFGPTIEMSVGFGFQRRIGAEKTDLYYGFAVGANI